MILISILYWLDDLYRRECCKRFGHVPSWTLAEAFGIKRPVCERCKETL